MRRFGRSERRACSRREQVPRKCSRMVRRHNRPGGRPSKYCKAVAARICRAVRRGCSRETAAALAGVSARTLYEWRDRIPQFSQGLKKADAGFQAQGVAAICKAGRRQWQAWAWMLERRFPALFGRVDRHVIREARTLEPKELEPAFIQAVCRALGFTGKLIPIGEPQPPEGGNNGDGEILDILPE